MTSACESTGAEADFTLRSYTPPSLGHPNRGRADAPAIAKELARELKWPPGRVQTALSEYEQACPPKACRPLVVNLF